MGYPLAIQQGGEIGMLFRLGHLVATYDGVPEGKAWRGLWVISRPDDLGPEGAGHFQQVDDGETPDLYENREAAAQAAESLAQARAEELYNEH